MLKHSFLTGLALAAALFATGCGGGRTNEEFGNLECQLDTATKERDAALTDVATWRKGHDELAEKIKSMVPKAQLAQAEAELTKALDQLKKPDPELERLRAFETQWKDHACLISAPALQTLRQERDAEKARAAEFDRQLAAGEILPIAQAVSLRAAGRRVQDEVDRLRAELDRAKAHKCPPVDTTAYVSMQSFQTLLATVSQQKGCPDICDQFPAGDQNVYDWNRHFVDDNFGDATSALYKLLRCAKQQGVRKGTYCVKFTLQ